MDVLMELYNLFYMTSSQRKQNQCSDYLFWVTEERRKESKSS